MLSVALLPIANFVAIVAIASANGVMKSEIIQAFDFSLKITKFVRLF